MIINKTFSYWKIDGNRNWKFGCQEVEIHRKRKPGEETLEEEFLRLFPRMWEKVMEPTKNQRRWHENLHQVKPEPRSKVSRSVTV